MAGWEPLWELRRNQAELNVELSVQEFFYQRLGWTEVVVQTNRH